MKFRASVLLKGLCLLVCLTLCMGTWAPADAAKDETTAEDAAPEATISPESTLSPEATPAQPEPTPDPEVTDEEETENAKATAAPLDFGAIRQATFDVGKDEGYAGDIAANARVTSAHALALLRNILTQSKFTADPESYDRAVNEYGNSSQPVIKRERVEVKNNKITLSTAKSGTVTLGVIRCGNRNALLVYKKKHYEAPLALIDYMLAVNGVRQSSGRDDNDEGIALLERYGLTPVFSAKYKTYTLPKSLVMRAESGPEITYWAQVNELSAAIGLKFSEQVGKKITADVYPLLGLYLNEDVRYETYPYAVVYRVGDKPVGAHIGLPYAYRGDFEEGSPATSLDGKNIEAITGGTFDAWLGAQLSREGSYAAKVGDMTPMQIARQFEQAIRKGDSKLFHAVCTRRFGMDTLFSEEEAVGRYVLPAFESYVVGIPYRSVRYYGIGSSTIEIPEDLCVEVPVDYVLSVRLPDNEARALSEVGVLVMRRDTPDGPYLVDEIR